MSEFLYSVSLHTYPYSDPANRYRYRQPKPKPKTPPTTADASPTTPAATTELEDRATTTTTTTTSFLHSFRRSNRAPTTDVDVTKLIVTDETDETDETNKAQAHSDDTDLTSSSVAPAPALVPEQPVPVVTSAPSIASTSQAAPVSSRQPPRRKSFNPSNLAGFNNNIASHWPTGHHRSHHSQNHMKKLHKRDPDNRDSQHTSSSSANTTSGAGPSSSSSTAGRPPKTNDVARQRRQYDDMVPEPKPFVPPPRFGTSVPFHRSASVSSGPPNSSLPDRSGVMASNENLHRPAEGSGSASTTSASTFSRITSVGTKPFVVRNNRTYIHEPTLAYPMPVDLAELHRQSLRTLLTFQLFGGPIISPAFASRPPSRVLEVGCGSAFWSMMCHRYFAQHSHASISFTGMDIVPLTGSGLDPNSKPDSDMRWRFVQHDMRRLPWPFADNEFDLIMAKDISLGMSWGDNAPLFEEYLRVLKPGGVVEIWETDSNIRMLRPHVLKTMMAPMRRDDSDSDSSDDDDDEDSVTKLGAYTMTTNTPLSAPLNPFLVEFNGWVTKALDARGLSAVPCTLIGPFLLQESEALTDVRSKRLAVPLSEIRWEREGVGGVVTKDGKSYIDSMKGKNKTSSEGRPGGNKSLSAGQSALRRTALETTVGLILSLEPLLREVSGKSQDEWDGWAAKMINDLLRDGGTSWGECLEVGAWTARKRPSKKA